MNSDKQIRIFVVDDEDVTRELVAETLAREPDFVVVGTCSYAGEAIGKVLEAMPDVVVMDLNFPNKPQLGYDGLTAILEINERFDELRKQGRSTRPHAPDCVICTAFDPIESGWKWLPRALVNGARGFVFKNSFKRDLVNVIRRVNQGEEVFLGVPTEVLSAARETKTAEVLFTLKESEVFRLLLQGKSCKEIADDLGIIDRVARTHLIDMRNKTNTDSDAALVLWGRRNGYTEHLQPRTNRLDRKRFWRLTK